MNGDAARASVDGGRRAGIDLDAVSDQRNRPVVERADRRVVIQNDGIAAGARAFNASDGDWAAAGGDLRCIAQQIDTWIAATASRAAGAGNGNRAGPTRANHAERIDINAA